MLDAPDSPLAQVLFLFTGTGLIPPAGDTGDDTGTRPPRTTTPAVPAPRLIHHRPETPARPARPAA
jgi:hypothetical protein